MNDDLEAAEAGLGQGNSTFHKVRLTVSRPYTPKADCERTFADEILGAPTARQGHDNVLESDLGI